MSAHPRTPALTDRARLVLLSSVMLFTELVLIRWVGSNVLYLSYFSNFVLLGSFLGIGVGFLRARAKADLFRWAPVAFAGLVAFVRLFPVEIDSTGSDLIYFGDHSPTGLPTWVMLPVLFVAVAAVMALIANGVAKTFALFEPLEAYRLDIIGSIAGILAFSGLAFLGAPPVAWGAVLAVAFLLLLGDRIRAVQIVAVCALVLVLVEESLGPGASWSPYYKVELSDHVLANGDEVSQVNVNGIPHQQIESVDVRRRREPIYFVPYERIARAPGRVLIVGAGNGSDVAIALAEGATTVDAVEIDPRLYRIGAQKHPDRPYDDPRVDVHIDDGRAFLERSDARWDLILFALPDSLTLVAGQSSLRLESYLFTVEAMRAARAHLAPGGIFGMYNYYREQWLVDRLARTLDEAFGRPPCVDSVGGEGHLALLLVGEDADVACPSAASTGDAVAPSTDDHPFLYLRTDTIPGFYLLTIGLIALASLLIVRLAGGAPLRRMATYLDLFFMGAAFLLLETKSVVQFALLFGTTWFVNALVFTGVLLAVLAAVEVARRVTLARPVVLYAALLGAIAVAFAVPQHVLLGLTFGPRFALATLLAFTPIFIANLVFAQRFASVGDSTTGFGANLLGAMVGGVVEYVSLITGYRILLMVVALLYALAFIAGRRTLTAAGT